MYQYKGLEDTITAIATPAGQGAVAIVRISGKDAVALADTIVRLGGKRTLSASQSHTVQHGWVVNAGETLDEVLVTLMRAPKSYTAEDVVEINCHGGQTVTTGILQAVLAAGARLALPGEFTRRAFLNGRMDLAQAEAVIDIIQAKTATFLRQSQHQLKGELSAKLHAMREGLLKIYTMIEAGINFPEDGIDAHSRKQILEDINILEKDLAELLGSSRSGRILKEGVRIVLCGKPNVGKSSLLNALLKEQRAIVTSIAGTTRDVLEEQAQIKGVPVTLVDTAGILEPRDPIEQEAVSRSRLYIKSADLVLLVMDQSRPLEEQDKALMDQLKTAGVLAVINKKDLDCRLDLSEPQRAFGADQVVSVSAFEPSSVRRLEAKIAEVICKDKDFDTNGILISNVRHIQALEEAQKNLLSAVRLVNENVSLEFVSEEIKCAVNRLDAVTGRNIDEDLLERIFSEFCIGK